MKPAAFEYRAPTSLEEVFGLLEANPDAKLLAGGQSLVPVLNFRLAAPPLLIDLNRIPALAGVAFERIGALTIGAMTRHGVFETDPRVRRAPSARAPEGAGMSLAAIPPRVVAQGCCGYD